MAKEYILPINKFYQDFLIYFYVVLFLLKYIHNVETLLCLRIKHQQKYYSYIKLVNHFLIKLVLKVLAIYKSKKN